MAHADSRDLSLSTTSPDAARAYRDGVDLLLSTWPGAIETLQRAVAADPDFALARAALARAHATRAQVTEARACIAGAVEAAARNGTARERSHVATLSLAINGQGQAALEHALAHLDDWPRDVVIFALPMGAFGLFAFSGMAGHDQARVDLCERHAGRFADDDWWFLTYRGWSQTENGAVARGRDLTRRGLDLRPANANAVHALAHAMVEDGASHEADALIAGWLPGYDRAGLLHGHLAWHQALAALEAGDADRALAIHDHSIRAAASLGTPLNIVTDTVSLLWRLRAAGHPVPADAWARARTHAEAKFPAAGHAFVDVHMGLVLAATGAGDAAAARIAAIEGGSGATGPVVAAICRAALAFVDGDYAGCATRLAPMAADIARIGGSGAQRALIHDMLLQALMRSGEAGKARALLDARVRRHL